MSVVTGCFTVAGSADVSGEVTHYAADGGVACVEMLSPRRLIDFIDLTKASARLYVDSRTLNTSEVRKPAALEAAVTCWLHESGRGVFTLTADFVTTGDSLVIDMTSDGISSDKKSRLEW